MNNQAAAKVSGTGTAFSNLI